MDTEKLLATIIAPLEYYAKALESGEITGAEAGAGLELMLAGARAEIEASRIDSLKLGNQKSRD